MPDDTAKIATPDSRPAEETFGAEYYASHCGLPYRREEPHWNRFFGGIADHIVRSLRPRRVFDAGCAHGFLLEALWDRGVEAWGRDISHFAISEVRADLQSFVAQGSIADPIEGEYDLIICIEVLEHMQEAEAVRAIAAMAAAAPRLLFSSSPNDLAESTHINVKPVIWWLRRFAEAGMRPAADYDASFVTSHAYLLERSAEQPSARESAAFAELVRQRMLAHERAAQLVGAEQRAAQAEQARQQEAARAAQAEQARQQEAARAAAATAEAERARQRESAAAAATGVALAERARLEADAARAAQETAAAREAVQAMAAETERLRQHAGAASAALAAHLAEQARFKALAAETAQMSASALEAELAAARAGEAAARAERDALLYSATWRATRPLRRLGQMMPAPARRAVRRLVRGGYWLTTLQFRRRMAERCAIRAALEGTGPVPAGVCPPAETPWALLPEPARTDAPFAAAPSETEYERWVREYDTLTDDDRAAIRTHVDRLRRKPLISVVMPAYETPERLLRAAVASVRAQLYPHWELCIADDASPSETVARVLREVAFTEPRIKWMRRDSNGHIAAATNSALSLATGEFVALMDHDDLLSEHTLYEVAVELDTHPETDLLYSDEDRIGPDGKRRAPYFKTDWNPDLLLGQNAVSHLGVYRRALLEQIGGLRSGFEGSQDYELVLRTVAASEPARIRHVPAVLYHWRESDQPSSFSQVQLDRCVDAARRAIGEHLCMTGSPVDEVVAAPAAPAWSRVRWRLPDPAPRVSLIVPTRDRAELLARCVAGLLLRTDYREFELLIVDNDSAEPETRALFDRLLADKRVRVLSIPGPFNYSAINNAAVREATGEVLVLLNNDIDVIDPDWLREMVSQAMRQEVGAVGAKLLYPDNTVQHGGVLLGMGHFDNGPGVAGHIGVGASRDDPGYFGSLALTRDFSSVTGACLALRREVFNAVGGFDETNLPVAFNDVDLCLRIGERGWRVMWTPFAELYHLESASRGSDIAPDKIERFTRECRYMRRRWGKTLDADPFCSPNLSRDQNYPATAFPPRRIKPWRRSV